MTLNGFGSRGGGFGSSESAYKGRNTNSSNSNYNNNTSTPTDFSQLPPIKKDLYKEHPEVSVLTPAQVSEFRTTHSMHIIGKNIPKAIASLPT